MRLTHPISDSRRNESKQNAQDGATCPLLAQRTKTLIHNTKVPSEFQSQLIRSSRQYLTTENNNFNETKSSVVQLTHRYATRGSLLSFLRRWQRWVIACSGSTCWPGWFHLLLHVRADQLENKQNVLFHDHLGHSISNGGMSHTSLLDKKQYNQLFVQLSLLQKIDLQHHLLSYII